MSIIYFKIFNLCQKLRPWQSTKLKWPKLHLAELKKLFFHVWNALDWSILIRIEISKFQHVADHLLYQCSQMGFGISKVWNLQSFQSKSLPLTFSEFLFTVFEIYWFLGMIFHKGLPNWKLVDLGYFWSGHFMGWNFQHPFDYKFYWDDRLYADTNIFFLAPILRELQPLKGMSG